MKRLVAVLAFFVLVAACSGTQSPAEVAPSLVSPSADGGATGEHQSIPEGFPMPIPAGAEVVNQALEQTARGDGYWLELRYTDERAPSLEALYSTWLAEEGYQINVENPDPSMIQLTAVGNSASAAVVISVESGVTSLSLTWRP